MQAGDTDREEQRMLRFIQSRLSGEEAREEADEA
jgi:hypothetical protein